MSKILVLGTGGTIASTPTENGLSATLTGEDILGYCNISKEEADITVENLFSIDSTLMQPEDWTIIAEAIAERAEYYDGMVITHGTDTLAYTASMLSYMLGPADMPVIITGSMKSVVEENTDAIVNMKDSITAASSGICGVYAVFNRKLIKGSRVSKIRSVQFDAFISVNYPLTGEFSDKGTKFNVQPDRKGSGIKLDTAFETSIAVIKLFPGMDPELVKAIYNAGFKGIVIESYGTGGIPYRGRDLLSAITEIASEIPVLLTTQVVYDGVDLHTYEVGQRALSSGAISACDMSKEAAITKLMWTLPHTGSGKSKRDDLHGPCGRDQHRPLTRRDKMTVCIAGHVGVGHVYSHAGFVQDDSQGFALASTLICSQMGLEACDRGNRSGFKRTFFQSKSFRRGKRQRNTCKGNNPLRRGTRKEDCRGESLLPPEMCHESIRKVIWPWHYRSTHCIRVRNCRSSTRQF